MSRIVLASELAKRPIVTFDGRDIAQVKDVVYAGDGGRVAGFTLAGRGLLSGPMKTALPWRNVAGFGPAAVIVRNQDALVPKAEVFQEAQSEAGPARGDVLGSQVLADDGAALGIVTDVVVRIPDDGSAPADVVGYAIGPAGKRPKGQPAQFIPLPNAISASGQHLIVPARIRDFLTGDLTGFGEHVEAFRRGQEGT